jgi:hypothetical protein
MRLHGYCEKCKRLRYVTVRPLSLNFSKVPLGICAECEKDKR